MTKFQRTQYISIFTSLALVFLPVFVHAEAITLGGLNNLLGNIYDTIKSLALPVDIIVIALLGFQLASAGEDAQSKARIRNTAIALVLGNAILFGAEPIANAIINGSK
jgi:type IV secretory pathway VirB2 component (pilin)